MRATLLAQVREALAAAGYFLSDDGGLRPLAFDLVARRDGQLLIVKVLTNVDGLAEPIAHELRTIAQFLDGVPLVVGERSSSRDLENGAVYLRYGVRILTFDTLHEYLQDGVHPLVYAAPGGFYVNLDGERLRALREERNLSLGDLAQAAGVSRRAIGMYEEGMGAMVDVAARLEEFLNEALVRPYPAFQPHTERLPPPAPRSEVGSAFESAVLRALEEIGFRVATTAKSPFSAITREHIDGASEEGPRLVTERVMLTGFAAEHPDAARRAAATAKIAEVTESFGVFFVERTTTRVAIEGTPVVSREELSKVDDSDDLIGLLRERKGRQR